ncbi:MAG: hypothetical protein C5B53_02355 [Candidatus Melainabacteria bacterium]|nr:MAG: hypothetical protein C5B53_02355 [Candidatus Melainabacteria bacterium]
MGRDLNHNRKDRAAENWAAHEQQSSLRQELAALAWAPPKIKARLAATTFKKIEHGAEDGLKQLLFEQVRNLATMPAPLLKGIQAQIGTLRRIERYCVKKIHDGDLEGVLKDTGQIGTALERAFQNIARLTPYQFGRTLGHDLPGVLAANVVGAALAKVPTILKEFKVIDQASNVVADCKESQMGLNPSQAIEKDGNDLAKGVNRVKCSVREDSLDLDSDRQTVRSMNRKSQESDGENDDRLRKKKDSSFESSPEFAARLQKIVAERLSPLEKRLVYKNDIQVKPVSRFVDISDCLGRYVPLEKSIYIAEYVKKQGEWRKNEDIAFTLKHEVGHLLNALLEDRKPISERAEFCEAFAQDFPKVPKTSYDSLGLSKEGTDLEEELRYNRDEVFAALYAHASGIVTKDYELNRVKKLFPRCYSYVRGLF